ncbi:MAG: 4Fe-4S binding protein [Candidatus Bipolaricaulota bacterium]|nr:MAG: 4Fe-4S binding protein [Candidatus Bipolaricaulota bacterium]
MGIEPHHQHDNHNCIKCGKCVDDCRFDALSLGFGVRKLFRGRR